MGQCCWKVATILYQIFDVMERAQKARKIDGKCFNRDPLQNISDKPETIWLAKRSYGHWHLYLLIFTEEYSELFVEKVDNRYEMDNSIY